MRCIDYINQIQIDKGMRKIDGKHQSRGVARSAVGSVAAASAATGANGDSRCDANGDGRARYGDCWTACGNAASGSACQPSPPYAPTFRRASCPAALRASRPAARLWGAAPAFRGGTPAEDHTPPASGEGRGCISEPGCTAFDVPAAEPHTSASRPESLRPAGLEVCWKKGVGTCRCRGL